MTVTAEQEPLLYRVPEAARMLSLGKSKTWELVARGELESVKIDGSRRVPAAAIEAYVRHLRAGDSDAPAA